MLKNFRREWFKPAGSLKLNFVNLELVCLLSSRTVALWTNWMCDHRSERDSFAHHTHTKSYTCITLLCIKSYAARIPKLGKCLEMLSTYMTEI